jgi:hypothetical protein
VTTEPEPDVDTEPDVETGPDCTVDCDGKECGDDSCGGDCGTCLMGSSCQAGECVTGVSTGEFGAACDGPTDCFSGYCLPGPDGDVCTKTCLDTCPDGWSCEDAGDSGDPTFLCLFDEDACVGDCAGKACGDDGCGESCGGCGAGTTCEAGACVCAPDCNGLSCGDDGCGESCGSCDAGATCEAGACVCEPACGAALCGDDGCGESCGDCDAGTTCEAGACVCAPSCGAAAGAVVSVTMGGSATPGRVSPRASVRRRALLAQRQGTRWMTGRSWTAMGSRTASTTSAN